jgi:hypothetical protein
LNNLYEYLVQQSLTVVLSHQDGCRSAVALLLKAALIQVSDYRLLGASGLLCLNYVQIKTTHIDIIAVSISLSLSGTSENQTFDDNR